MQASTVLRSAMASAVLFGVVAVLGLPTAATLQGAVVCGAALLVLARSSPGSARGPKSWRSFVAIDFAAAEASWSDRPGEPQRAAWIRRATLMVLAVPLLLALLIQLVGLPLVVESEHLWPWRGVAITVAIISSAVFISSLIDWSFVVPRLSGAHGVHCMPCQASDDSEETWERVTRLWLGHRIAAYLAIRVGGLLALVFVVASFKPNLGLPTGTIVGAIGAAVLVFFLNRFVPVLTLVSNPPLQVGDKVVLAEEYGAGVHEQPVYYVVDVAIEGVKLLQLGLEDAPIGNPARSHDRSLSLADLPRLLRTRDRFTGCRERCSKANRYCTQRKFGELVSNPEA